MPGFNIPNQYTPNCGENNVNGEASGAFTVDAPFAGPAHLSETARKHRYRLEILGPLGQYSMGGSTGILMFLEKCTRPTPEVDEIVIHNGQDEIYRPGKHRWSPVEFTFYEKTRGNDVQVDEAAELIYQWWGQTMINLNTSEHRTPTDYYRRAHLQMLDGVGNPIWTYYLHDCWPQKVSPIDLSYSDSDIATITVTLRFNKAEERRI